MSPELASFLQQVEGTSASTFSTEAERLQARNAASALLTRLRTPWDSIWHYGWSAPAFIPCLKVCSDIKLFEKWAARNAEANTTASADELANLVKVDPAFLKRILRFLAVMHVVDEQNRDVYTLTPWALSLATPLFQHTVNFIFDINIEGFHNLPTFLKSVGYQNPSDPVTNSFSTRFGKSIWDLYKENQTMTIDFQNTMTAFAQSKTPWTKVYPVSRLFVNLKPGRVILVDVGGGHGSDISLVASLEEASQYLTEGCLVLQDFPGTLASANVPNVVRKQDYDAFTEQPVKGARAYYMHIVLHDFPDTEAIKILKRQAEAMERGYSRLLIYEAVVGAGSPEEAEVTMANDMIMMMIFNSSERTLETWESVLGAAGLKIVEIHSNPLASESVIEAELA